MEEGGGSEPQPSLQSLCVLLRLRAPGDSRVHDDARFFYFSTAGAPLRAAAALTAVEEEEGRGRGG